MRLLDSQLALSPTDLHSYLECRHLTQLDLKLLRGEIDGPDGKHDPKSDLIARKGDEHEARYLQSLRDEGKQVVEIPDTLELEEAAAATIAAMREGAEIIYQGAFSDPPQNGGPAWNGYADFLLRVPIASDLGDYSYEVADTKLARRTKPTYLLQLCFYSEQVARIQGHTPEHMHVILGTNEQHRYRLADFDAYYRHIRAQFIAEVAASPLETYPYPVSHCSLCEWSDRCDQQRIDDDHLTLVAGMRSDQVVRLNDNGIDTLAGLAVAQNDSPTTRLPQATYSKLRHQASLQLEHRNTDTHTYDLLEPEQRRGFATLPPPDPGDLFFDIEGDPLYDNGLEYLWGVIATDTGAPVYHAFWGHSRDEEKLAFEQFIDFVVAQRAKHPEMHVYHYAHYEVTAMKQLASFHATRENEVDDLLRGEVFIDLYKVVRQGMRISQPSYSLKKVEVFYMEPRDASVTDGEDSIVQYERYVETGDRSILDGIAAYNEEDCLSTLKLRDWLLERRIEAEERFGPEAGWAEPKESERSEQAIEEEGEIGQLQRELLAGISADQSTWSDDERARTLMAQLVDYHRRENKPAHWIYFERLGMSAEELIEDADSLSDVRPVEGAEPIPDKQSLIYSLRFPPQEHKIRPGNKWADPFTEKGVNVVALDNVRGTLQIRRGKRSADEPLPRAIIPSGPVRNEKQRAAVRRVARALLAGEGYRALRDVVAGELPRFVGREPGASLQPGAFELEQAKALAAGLDESYLFVQGPPGSGKTYSGGRLLVHLMQQGKRVGVTAQSHKAIHELLASTEEAAKEVGFAFKGLKKSSGEDSEYEGEMIDNADDNAAFPPPDDVQLVAGTAWLFSREEMEGALDYLFIDEAGQIALADALAVGTAAHNLILLGDPQQLAQVTQGVHPGESGKSVLEHLLGDDSTIPPERGLFLDRTYRMHPDVCEFISEVMYEGRLESVEACGAQSFAGAGALTGTGIRYVPVEADGNSRESIEEANAIAAAVGQALVGTVTGSDGEARRIRLDEILVVTPYNAQVRALADRLPKGVRVGTVDKFQGQEAAVVFFSMATSSGAELPRNLEFLFSRNRLNVAISRAKCLAVLVASPELLRIRCRTVEQMRMVNALCRLVEVARE